eukprot:6057736-Amphidinium_carterae.1
MQVLIVSPLKLVSELWLLLHMQTKTKCATTLKQTSAAKCCRPRVEESAGVPPHASTSRKGKACEDVHLTRTRETNFSY